MAMVGAAVTETRGVRLQPRVPPAGRGPTAQRGGEGKSKEERTERCLQDSGKVSQRRWVALLSSVF